MLTVSSGAEVPKATIVRPITKFEMRNRLAKAAAPSVRASAPTRISTNPMTTKMTDIHSLFILIYPFIYVILQPTDGVPKGHQLGADTF